MVDPIRQGRGRFNTRTGEFETDDAGTDTRTSVASNPLPMVSDPERTLTAITRQEYLDNLANFSDLENELLERASTDTSLIDYAREDAATAQERTEAIAARNRSRYGLALTPAELREQDRTIRRGSTLGGVQAIADARIAQRDQNRKLLADLIGIGQGIGRSGMEGLGGAAANAAQRENAYRNAQAQSKQATYGAIGSLGSMAIMALML